MALHELVRSDFSKFETTVSPVPPAYMAVALTTKPLGLGGRVGTRFDIYVFLFRLAVLCDISKRHLNSCPG